jgi:hypothetical protein
VSQYSIEGLPRFTGHDVLVLDTCDDPDGATAPAAGLDRAAQDQNAVVAGLGIPVPLILGFGTRAANRAMKSTGSKATCVPDKAGQALVPSR